MTSPKTATAKGISLYPDHWDLIALQAQLLGLRGPKTRSPALQSILEEWARMKGIIPGHPVYKPLREEEYEAGNRIVAIAGPESTLVAHEAPAIVNASPTALAPYPPYSSRVNFIREPIANLIEASDRPCDNGDLDDEIEAHALRIQADADEGPEPAPLDLAALNRRAYERLLRDLREDLRNEPQPAA